MPGKKKGGKEKVAKSCNAGRHDHTPCGRKLYDDEHCIFHSKDIDGKKDKFNDAFWKEYERQEKEGNVFEFTWFVFPGDISFAKKVFEKVAYFGGAQFSGAASFEKATFTGEASFEKAKFSERAYFRGALFSGEAYFVKATFYGEANFTETQFSKKAEFFGAQFSGAAYFWEAQFSGKANFWYAEFNGKSFFKNVYFKDFGQCNMIDTYFYNVSGLLEYLAENKKKFKHPRGIKYLHDKCKPILGEATVSRLPLLSREIRDDVYLLSFLEKHPKMHFIWWLFADCGRSFLWWALWSLILAEVFAIIFGIFYDCNPLPFKSEVISFSWPGISLLYYSIVTFTTLGFGDIVPKIPTLQIIVMLEVILGYIMLGFLISIGANKLARRS